MVTSGKIFITTGRGGGKGLIQRLLYEKCLNLESNALEGPFELEKVIDFWNKYDEVKESTNMVPKTDFSFAFRSPFAGMQILNAGAFEIKNIIVNQPATIVFWEDGTKTVVKCENEEFDLEKAIAMAFARKALGNRWGYYNVFKKWLKKLSNKE